MIEGFSTAVTLSEQADLLVAEISGSIATEEGNPDPHPKRRACATHPSPNPNPDPYPDPSPDPGPSPHQVREVAEEEFEVEATIRSLRGGAAASNTVEYTLRDAPKGAKYSCVEAAS